MQLARLDERGGRISSRYGEQDGLNRRRRASNRSSGVFEMGTSWWDCLETRR
jgi:hypothetical protein